MHDNLSYFTREVYKELLIFLKKRYNIIPFCKFSEMDSHILILRHDIDFSIKKAFSIAKIESEMGIKSTYFVLLSNKFYNIFNGENNCYLKNILKMGHEIGLHYDIGEYKNYSDTIDKTIQMEINILENIIGTTVHSISMHNPGEFSKDPFSDFDKYINAYSIIKDQNLFYVSDSCRAWRINTIHKLLKDNPKKVQLLIHPFLWDNDNPSLNRFELLDKMFIELEKEHTKDKDNWKALWNKASHINEYDKKINGQMDLLKIAD